MKYLFFSIFFLININSYSQKLINECDELISNIKSTYPEYRDSKEKYKFINYAEKIKLQIKDTFEALSKILAFYNNPHLNIYNYPEENLKIDFSKDNTFLASIEYNTNKKITKKKFEGFWINGDRNCIVSLVKKDNDYIAYVYKGVKSNYLHKGAVCFKINKRDKKLWTRYTNPTRSYTIFRNSIFKNDSVLYILGESNWYKLKNIEVDIEKIQNQNTVDAIINKIDSNTFVLKMPSFYDFEKEIIDSLIENNMESLKKTKHLIIDIRDNTGGIVDNYQKLFPLLFTNTTYTQSGYIYPNIHKIKHYMQRLEIRKKEGNIERVKFIETSLLKFNKYINSSYLSLGDTIVFDKVEKFPQKVSILINNLCQSAAELMILDFKQSKKVKLFGQSTMGAVDYLDTEDFKSAIHGYDYYIPTVKRVIKKGETGLDNIGIKPDVIIKDNVQDWVKFVIDYYEK